MNRPSVVWIMTTNHLDKIDRGIQNRCHLISMHAATPAQWVARCNQVITACSGQPVSNAILEQAIGGCNGSARDIMNIALKFVPKAAKHAPNGTASGGAASP